MHKFILSIGCICLLSFCASGQLMVSKLLGKDAKTYGVGYGMFVYLDFPLASANQSLRVELVDFAYHPTKGDGFFTAEEGKGYYSFRLGYKYVFSETQSGFYLLPSAGAANVMIITKEEPRTDAAWGIASALEGGYSISVGEAGHHVNLGIKFEHDFVKKTHATQSLAFKISYSTGLFGRR